MDDHESQRSQFFQFEAAALDTDQQASHHDPGIIMPMNELIYNAHHLLGLHLTSRQISSLETYELELLRWNEQVKLNSDPRAGTNSDKAFS